MQVAPINYISRQTEIKPGMRTVLVDWLFEVSYCLKFPASYIHRAVKYLDILIEYQNIPICDFQMYGCAALSLVDLYCSSLPQDPRQWVDVSSYSFTGPAFFSAQMTILKYLKYNILQFTFYDDILARTRHLPLQQKEQIEFVSNFALHNYALCIENQIELVDSIIAFVIPQPKMTIRLQPFLKDIFRDQTIIQSIFKENETLLEALKQIHLSTQTWHAIIVSVNPQTFKSMDIDEIDFEIKSNLGSGAYGVVKKCILSPASKTKFKKPEFAFKHFKLESYVLDQSTLREIAALNVLKHENIIECYGIFEIKSEIYAALELGVALPGYPTNEKNKMSLIKNIIDGIQFMHNRGFVHRDIKPQNIIVVNNVAKIVDFGFTTHNSVFTERQDTLYEIVTLWYRAPELILGEVAKSCSLDIWALGCVIIEILFGRPLFTSNTEIGQLFAIFMFLGTPNNQIWDGVENYTNWSASFPKWNNENKLVKELKSLTILSEKQINAILRMFVYDPRKRINIDDVAAAWSIC